MKKLPITKTLLDFYIQIEKSKTTMRHSYTSDPTRQESTAEHSWMLALIAMTLFDELKIKVDQLKVLKLVLIHDLPEIITKDIPAFEVSERQNNKKSEESKAVKELFKKLPPKVKKEFTDLWNEYEEKETVEAQIAQSLDKMEVIIQHDIADYSTWDDGDFSVHAFYRSEYFDFHAFMRKLRDEVESMSIIKVGKSNMFKKIAKEHQETYRKLYKKLKK